MLIIAYIFCMALCWGSFLNLLAYRIVHGVNFWTSRSYCPACKHVLTWYENIPVFSWLFLQGRCRSCKASISWLYPFIEICTAVLFTGIFFRIVWPVYSLFPDDMLMLHFIPTRMWFSLISYIVFFSALVAATRTDLDAMVIPQCFSLWLVPFGLVSAAFGFLEITFLQSCLGVVFGYGMLWLVGFLFKKATHKDGMGIGDMELMALIGSFLGPVGVWTSIMIGSLSGMVFGAIYLYATKKSRSTRIPFGPFLALGAATHFFFEYALFF